MAIRTYRNYAKRGKQQLKTVLVQGKPKIDQVTFDRQGRLFTAGYKKAMANEHVILLEQRNSLKRGLDLKAKQAAMRRDKYICQVCKRAVARDVDHIEPLAWGGADTIDNMQAICQPCHAKKTKEQVFGYKLIDGRRWYHKQFDISSSKVKDLATTNSKKPVRQRR